MNRVSLMGQGHLVTRENFCIVKVLVAYGDNFLFGKLSFRSFFLAKCMHWRFCIQVTTPLPCLFFLLIEKVIFTI